MLRSQVNVQFQHTARSYHGNGKVTIGAIAGEQTVEVIDIVKESSAHGHNQVAGSDPPLAADSPGSTATTSIARSLSKSKLTISRRGRGTKVAVIPKCTRRTRP